MSNIPSDAVWGADNVTVSALPTGFKVYGGYWNGPYANMTALRARFPKSYLISIAVRLAGSTGALAVDAEPGTLAPDQGTNFALVAQFLRSYHGGQKATVYTMASWAQPLVNYLTAHGIPRSSYYLWSAHYSGQHLCGPGGCGFLNQLADATQYATGANDYNVFRGYMVGAAPDPTPAGTVAKLGYSGAVVSTIQKQLNAWAGYCGFAPLRVDGDFGGKTFDAVQLFQKKRGQGLKVNGVVDANTEKFLQNPPGIIKKTIGKVKPTPKPVVPSGKPTLQLGSTGKQVAAMQYYLSHSGIDGVRGIDADGDFGGDTQTAVRNFQRWAHFPDTEWDAVYGPDTAKALAKIAKA